MWLFFGLDFGCWLGMLGGGNCRGWGIKFVFGVILGLILGGMIKCFVWMMWWILRGYLIKCVGGLGVMCFIWFVGMGRIWIVLIIRVMWCIWLKLGCICLLGWGWEDSVWRVILLGYCSWCLRWVNCFLGVCVVWEMLMGCRLCGIWVCLMIWMSGWRMGCSFLFWVWVILWGMGSMGIMCLGGKGIFCNGWWMGCVLGLIVMCWRVSFWRR